MQEEITRYFETHPSEKTMPVIDVWRKLAEGLTSKNPSEGGETWKNAHWYLNGLWWHQTSELEHIGYLKGYLRCMRTHTESPLQTYSRPVTYYLNQIDTYVTTYPKADNEAIANILSRLQDKPKSNAGSQP